MTLLIVNQIKLTCLCLREHVNEQKRTGSLLKRVKYTQHAAERDAVGGCWSCGVQVFCVHFDGTVTQEEVQNLHLLDDPNVGEPQLIIRPDGLIIQDIQTTPTVDELIDVRLLASPPHPFHWCDTGGTPFAFVRQAPTGRQRETPHGGYCFLTSLLTLLTHFERA